MTDLLTGGRYLFRVADISIEATGPDGWVGYPSWALDGPEPVRADAPTGVGISFFTANGVYSDPCHWDVLGTGRADTGDVAVGPTVHDLVAALRANTFYMWSVATPVTIDGYAGQELELQLPDDPFTSCDRETADTGGHAFVFSGPGLYAQGPADRWHLYILDVDGTRLIAVILSYEGTPPGRPRYRAGCDRHARRQSVSRAVGPLHVAAPSIAAARAGGEPTPCSCASAVHLTVSWRVPAPVLSPRPYLHIERRPRLLDPGT